MLWRPTADGVVVAVVHRPRYDDWSLPKGKLEPGEHPLLGALREVAEETGWTGVPGRTLGVSEYRVLQGGALVPKRVRWWAVRATSGGLRQDDEVDELRWLPPADAERLLTAGRDVAPLRLLVAAGLGTSMLLLVRHAHAGSRREWSGDDEQRPLDERGRRQSELLAGVLRAYAPARIVSAPVLRCRRTVEPLRRETGLSVEVDPVFGEQAYAREPEAALLRLRELVGRPGATVVCAQRDVVPGLVAALRSQAGQEPGEVPARKGSLWALSLSGGLLVDADHTPPLA